MARESNLALELSPFHAQRFADEFFRYFHNQDSCRQLKALVIGSLNYPGVRDSNGTLQKCLPQYCYVKGVQADIMDRSIVVAVRVIRAQLRYTESYADILDCDPESEWLGDAAA
jgi:lysine/ornithine N-monooxygenase